MRTKIIAAFRIKYPAVNLSNTRLDEIAARIEKKITDESEIDATLESFNEFMPFDQISREDDALRNAVSLAKKPNEPIPAKTEAADPKGPAEKTTEEMPAWAQALLTEVKGLKAEKAASDIKGLVSGKLKDVPGVFWTKRALPATAEEVDAFVTDVNNDYSEFSKTNTVKQVGNISRNKGASTGSGASKAGAKPTGTESQASKEELDSIMKNIK